MERPSLFLKLDFIQITGTQTLTARSKTHPKNKRNQKKNEMGVSGKKEKKKGKKKECQCFIWTQEKLSRNYLLKFTLTFFLKVTP